MGPLKVDFRDASKHTLPEVSSADKKRFKKEMPSIRAKDYIEYDFSTMKDSRGGFLDQNEPTGFAQPEEPLSLQEWKEKQKREQVVKELAPPLDLEKAPRCVECNSLEVDANFFTNFNVNVCRRCKKEHPDKYSLLTKTECKEDYLLTDSELRDTSLLHRIEKPNPHGFLRMQLFLRMQVEEYAWKKWGLPKGLDLEWEKRERTRLDRKEKRYQAKLKEMRKRTRAEEYTRKLRNGQLINERHEHLWSAPLATDGPENMIKRRCIECGIETEELVILNEY